VENRRLRSPESPNLDGASQTFLGFWTLSQERKEDKKKTVIGGPRRAEKAQAAPTLSAFRVAFPPQNVREEL
jgi:hypothetical protein